MSVRKCDFESHVWFCFSSFESFFSHQHSNFWALHEHFRQLPFADSYEHFISLRSPGGVRVQFALSKPCLTSNASLVNSQRHTPLLLLPVTQVGCHRLWWDKSVQWFGCYCAFKHFQVFQRAQRWMAVNTSDKLAGAGFIHPQQPL